MAQRAANWWIDEAENLDRKIAEHEIRAIADEQYEE
jgi:hypothetical protein